LPALSARTGEAVLQDVVTLADLPGAAVDIDVSADGEWIALCRPQRDVVVASAGQQFTVPEEIRFRYREHEFEIEMNYHGACSVYFVNSPSCPDEILIEVADYFDRQLID
jgi:hypothetical protein